MKLHDLLGFNDLSQGTGREIDLKFSNNAQTAERFVVIAVARTALKI